jgi:WhiB family transcriptional regulator, redox-sensing transcriptional regulator
MSEPATAGAATAALGPWALRGLCSTANPELFFPPRGDPAAEARRICVRCPVHAECLEYALAAGEEFGVWGGLDPHERKNLARHRKRLRSVPGKGAA